MYNIIPKEEKSFEEEQDNYWWIVSIICMVILFIPVAFWLGRVLR